MATFFTFQSGTNPIARSPIPVPTIDHGECLASGCIWHFPRISGQGDCGVGGVFVDDWELWAKAVPRFPDGDSTIIPPGPSAPALVSDSMRLWAVRFLLLPDSWSRFNLANTSIPCDAKR